MAREKCPKPRKYRQNTDVKQHFHPRWLARAVVHNQMAHNDIFGMNKVRPGATQSAFAQHWRDEAEMIAK